jgi:hypothetical protein
MEDSLGGKCTLFALIFHPVTHAINAITGNATDLRDTFSRSFAKRPAIETICPNKLRGPEWLRICLSITEAQKEH